MLCISYVVNILKVCIRVACALFIELCGCRNTFCWMPLVSLCFCVCVSGKGLFFFLFFAFLGLHLQHTEVPRLGDQLEQELHQPMPQHKQHGIRASSANSLEAMQDP